MWHPILLLQPFRPEQFSSASLDADVDDDDDIYRNNCLAYWHARYI